MRKACLALAAALCAASGALASGDAQLPLPPELEPNVRFWLRIYTEVTDKALVKPVLDAGRALAGI